MAYREELNRIREALLAATETLEAYTPGAVAVSRKAGGDPVTEADQKVNDLLLSLLPRSGEGWLSEETTDNEARLDKHRVWIVDPLDGTKEFVSGIPEWCVSIGLVEDGRPVAGGILNPVTGELFLGAEGSGVMRGDEPVRPTDAAGLDGAVVLASRSETARGEWEVFSGRSFEVKPMGSVAYKLALVAAGSADATWTLVPKHEWDVAAGVALVTAGGGSVAIPGGTQPVFNRPHPLLKGLIASGPGLFGPLRTMLGS